MKPRILLAEDHPLVRDALLCLLGELGEVVGAVGDGQALLEAAQQLKPDIVISDISIEQGHHFDGLSGTGVPDLGVRRGSSRLSPQEHRPLCRTASSPVARARRRSLYRGRGNEGVGASRWKRGFE